jgi:AcrR family transcriptional regulator/DNA-binding MarR family transcriptional regulator
MPTIQREPTGNVAREWADSHAEALPAGTVTALQRARMLAATMEVCAEHGAANLTVAHIVARSGVSRRTFYEVFADREDCFLAAFDEALQRAARQVRDAYDADAVWADRIRASLLALLSFFEDEPFAARLLVVESLGAGPRALERRSQALEPLTRTLDEGRRLGKIGAQAPPLTAEGVVGAVCSLLHARLLRCGAPAPVGSQANGKAVWDGCSLLALANQLMSMIVLPYLGAAAARRELARPPVRVAVKVPARASNPLKQLDMRLTYRTVRVLLAVAEGPGSSNRKLADAAGVSDPGQISKLLGRLHKLGLVENAKGASGRGEPNAWTLTEAGWRVHDALAQQATSA